MALLSTTHGLCLSRNLRPLGLAVLLLLAYSGSARGGAPAIESWADGRLPVQSGLEIWLDAGRQNAVRQARQLPALMNQGPADFWFDGSGKARHLAQRLPEARPRFGQIASSACFRFDGKDDFLAAANLGAAFTNATVVLVAAPRSNAGMFRACLALNLAGRNDYTTGLNLDLGPGGSPGFSFANAEGAGFQGARNLLKSAFPFGTFHTLSLVSAPGQDGVRLFIDGQLEGGRDRAASVLRMDEFTVGARCYSNTPEPPHTQGFFDGEIAEVLVYSRELSDVERQQVEKYLADKHASLRAAGDDPAGPRPLETVANPPPIQMLVPGFTVRELPLQLPNLNNIKYRADGKLVALGYNGRIWLLSDTDGDGLEDKATPFWDKDTLRSPIGLALTPPGYARGRGVFVPSKGKLSLIVDKDGDDRADEEIVVASGWQELPHGVDALGVALDAQGNIYFGLGAANFTDAYLIDKQTDQARYDLKSERGTILKVSPDFSKREVICTGIRFPVGMAFNRHGDLFCTDQEGATWLPNGNPFDELLHVQPGRHYGFPPRHPKHLPSVIDEPSVFDYAPQHQSTCGLCFNEWPPQRAAGVPPADQTSSPVARSVESQNFRQDAGSTCFGPSWWAGDAFVAGESRGKIYRTKLVKTASGYVARNNLIACVNALTVDLCVSPRGELVVATHSGKPDWGTGPQGIGKLYKITYSDTNAPQPVLTWSASPTEIRIAFDRPLNPTNLKNLAKETKITQGKYVAAGDRFESIRPGYQVVQDQMATPRYSVPVLSASVTPDHRTIVLTTPPRTAAVNYAIELPNISRSAEHPLGEEADVAKDSRRAGARRSSYDQIDLVTDLNGVAAEWKSTDGKESWQGWLPHVDLDVSREFTKGSAEHQRLWVFFKKPGTLTLKGQLNLWQMLLPAVQPGATVDWQYPPETASLAFESSVPFRVQTPNATTASTGSPSPRSKSVLQHQTVQDQWLPFEISLSTGNPEPTLALSWHTAEDNRPRPFPLRRFFLPWATPSAEPIKLAGERQIPELAGGNWLRGRRVFFSEQAACFKCHQVGGAGGKLGPDLSNLVHRDYASVLKDIREPSVAINPDHIASNVELTDGESLTGVLLADASDRLTLGDATGQSIVVPKTKVKSVKPATLSLMPEGLDKALGETAMKDLLTFLLLPGLEPAPLEREGAPPPRKRAEVEAVLAQGRTGFQPVSQTPSAAPAEVSKREDLKAGKMPALRVVLCDGPKDHGPGEHDYPLWKQRWSKLLALAEGVTIDTAHVWPGVEQFAKADVIVFFSANPGWNAARSKELDAFLARGGGAVFLHYAVNGQQDVEALCQHIGLAWRGGASKFRHGPLDLKLHDHPLSRGFGRLDFIDESYWNLVGDQKDIQLLASGVEEGVAQPLVWTRQQGKGRVFVSIPGHYTWTFDDPLFRLLILRGICWSAGQPIDRLVELTTVGARVD